MQKRILEHQIKQEAERQRLRQSEISGEVFLLLHVVMNDRNLLIATPIVVWYGDEHSYGNLPLDAFKEAHTFAQAYLHLVFPGMGDDGGQNAI